MEVAKKSSIRSNRAESPGGYFTLSDCSSDNGGPPNRHRDEDKSSPPPTTISARFFRRELGSANNSRRRSCLYHKIFCWTYFPTTSFLSSFISFNTLTYFKMLDILLSQYFLVSAYISLPKYLCDSERYLMIPKNRVCCEQNVWNRFPTPATPPAPNFLHLNTTPTGAKEDKVKVKCPEGLGTA